MNLSLIGHCTAVTLLVTDVDVVFGLVGSTMSPLILFILPALFYLKLQPEVSRFSQGKAQNPSYTGKPLR